jgi:AraC-like DNA-binding protein
MDVIIYLGISQSFFAAILMLTKKSSLDADKLLTAWLFLLGIEFTSCAFDLFFFESSLLSSVFLLINPAFFLYIKSLTTNDFKLKYIQLLHLLPFLAFELTTYFVQESFSPNFLSPAYPHFWFSISFSAINVLSLLFYNIYSVVLVRKHRINLRNEFSTIESYKEIAWLLFVLIFYILYGATAFLFGILAINFTFLQELPSIFTYSVMLSLAYILGFYGLRQKAIYEKTPIDFNNELVADTRYKSSTLKKEDIHQIRKMIYGYFDSNQPYLNPDFNMTALSDSIQIPKHHITQVLNMEIGQNFFSFVNQYRVKAVKIMLEDMSNPYSIEAIGYDCGFNSKSSFFTVFKSITGLTPLQYKSTIH